MECYPKSPLVKPAYRLVLFPAILLSLFLTSCYKDNEEALYLSSGTCDTINVSYTATIAPIMAANCNACHASGSGSAGVATDSYQALKDARVLRIRGAIRHMSGYSPMPQNSAQLSSCELAKFDAWINKGMPEN